MFVKLANDIKLLIKMAVRNTGRQKRRSLIVATTASIGILSVVFSQGLLNGFFDSMVIVAIETGLGHVQLRPKGYLDSRQTGISLEKADLLEKTFRAKLPENIRYAARIEKEAILRIGAEVRGIMIFGVEPKQESGVSTIPEWVVDGSFFNEEESDSSGAASHHGQVPCLVGTKNAEALEVVTGDGVILSTGGKGGESVSFRCRITGIFRSPISALDESLILMRRKDLSRLIGAGSEDEISYFVFHGDSHLEADAIKENLLSSLGGAGGIEIATMKELEPSVAGLFELYDQITVIFYFVILAGFGIVLFESVTMSIFERMHEIGIMHAIGTNPRFLFWLVIMEAFSVTMIGVVIGMTIGSVLVSVYGRIGIDFGGISLGNQAWGGGVGVVYPYLTWKDILDGVLVALTVAFFSGIYPARKAVHVMPVKAIYNR